MRLRQLGTLEPLSASCHARVRSSIEPSALRGSRSRRSCSTARRSRSAERHEIGGRRSLTFACQRCRSTADVQPAQVRARIEPDQEFTRGTARRRLGRRARRRHRQCRVRSRIVRPKCNVAAPARVAELAVRCRGAIACCQRTRGAARIRRRWNARECSARRSQQVRRAEAGARCRRSARVHTRHRSAGRRSSRRSPRCARRRRRCSRFA
jgi:hypothetical protein